MPCILAPISKLDLSFPSFTHQHTPAQYYLVMFELNFFYTLAPVFFFHCFFCYVCALAKMSFNMDLSTRSFRNLSLSYRGSERQAPNCLGLALRFSKIMQAKEAEFAPGTSTHERLAAVISEFHSTPGLTQKHKLDDDKQRTVYNMIAGTSPDLWHVHKVCSSLLFG